MWTRLCYCSYRIFLTDHPQTNKQTIKQTKPMAPRRPTTTATTTNRIRHPSQTRIFQWNRPHPPQPARQPNRMWVAQCHSRCRQGGDTAEGITADYVGFVGGRIDSCGEGEGSGGGEGEVGGAFEESVFSRLMTFSLWCVYYLGGREFI